MSSSTEWNIIEAYETINKKIPKKHNTGFADIPVILTTLCAFEQCICLGTQIGIVYMIYINQVNVVTIQVSNKHEAITSISGNAGQHDMLAVGFESGWTSVLQLPKYQEDGCTMLAHQTPSSLFKWFDKKLTSDKISCFSWAKNGERLFVGSFNGNIHGFTFDYESKKCEVTFLINVDSPVIQLDYNRYLLAISSEKCCSVFNVTDKSLCLCGENHLRPVKGQFGCIFLQQCGSKKLPMLLSTRAHHRLWLSNHDGIVNWTYIGYNISSCDELFQDFSSPASEKRPYFGKLYPVNDHLVLSCSSKHIIIYDINEKIPVAYMNNNGGRFRDAASLNGDIILLLNNNQILGLSMQPTRDCPLPTKMVDQKEVTDESSAFPWLGSQLKVPKDSLRFIKTKILETTNRSVLEGLPVDKQNFESFDADCASEALEPTQPDLFEEIVVKSGTRYKKEQGIVANNTKPPQPFSQNTVEDTIEENSVSNCSSDLQNTASEATIEENLEKLSESIQLKEQSLASELGFSIDSDSSSTVENSEEEIDESEFKFDGLERLISTNSSVLTDDSFCLEDKVHPSFLKTLDSLCLSYSETATHLYSQSIPSMHSYEISLERTSTEDDAHTSSLTTGWTSQEFTENIKCISGYPDGILYSDESCNLFITSRSESSLQTVVTPKPVHCVRLDMKKSQCLVIMENALYSFHLADKGPSSSMQILWQDATYVTLDRNIIWLINSSGDVLVSKWAEGISFIALESESHKFVQITCRNGVVWGLTTEGELFYRVGIEVNGWGVDWAQAPLDSSRITNIHISSHGLGWKVDEFGHIFVLPYISQQFPQGLDARWWQVNTGSVALHEGQIHLTSDNKHLWMTQGSSAVYKHPLQSFIGYRWENRIPEELQCIDAGGVHIDHGVLYALKNENNLLMVNPRTLSIVEIPTPLKQPIHSISSRPEALWVLTERGEVYVRDGLGPNLNIGISWIKLDTTQIDDVHLSHISLGLEVVWAVDERGNVFMRQGPLQVSIAQSMPAAWLQIDAPPYVKFKKVFVGARSHIVWAIDTEQRIYVRQAISSDLATGLSWLGLNDIRALNITISEDRVFVLSTTGALYEREGVSSTNYIGDSWTKLSSASIIDITVSTDNCLWALNEEGKIMQQYILPIKNKSPPTSSSLDNLIESDDFEVI